MLMGIDTCKNAQCIVKQSVQRTHWRWVAVRSVRSLVYTSNIEMYIAVQSTGTCITATHETEAQKHHSSLRDYSADHDSTLHLSVFLTIVVSQSCGVLSHALYVCVYMIKAFVGIPPSFTINCNNITLELQLHEQRAEIHEPQACSCNVCINAQARARISVCLRCAASF